MQFHVAEEQVRVAGEALTEMRGQRDTATAEWAKQHHELGLARAEIVELSRRLGESLQKLSAALKRTLVASGLVVAPPTPIPPTPAPPGDEAPSSSALVPSPSPKAAPRCLKRSRSLSPGTALAAGLRLDEFAAATDVEPPTDPNDEFGVAVRELEAIWRRKGDDEYARPENEEEENEQDHRGTFGCASTMEQAE